MALQPTDMIAVTLSAQDWQIVLLQLMEGPYRVVMPLIGGIQHQCQAQDPERAGKNATDNVVPISQGDN